MACKIRRGIVKITGEMAPRSAKGLEAARSHSADNAYQAEFKEVYGAQLKAGDSLLTLLDLV